MAKEVEKTLAARQVGRNIVMFIEGVKFSKKTEDNDEVKSIKNKIDFYNKKPSKARLEEIKDIFTPPAAKEKAKKEVVKKGIKSSIKKETKKVASKKKVNKEDEIETGEELVKKVTDAHAAGTISDQQIKDLQKLLAKEEAKRTEEKKEEEKKQEQQKQSSGYKRAGEY